MKTTLKTEGFVEFDREDLTKIIFGWVKNELGYSPTKLQWPKDGNKKVVVVIDSVTDQGAKPIGRDVPAPKQNSKYEGTTHKWEGLYGAIGEILDEQRKRKKSFISYTDLLAELHEMEDTQGKKMFVKGNDKLPMAILRHRLAPSQIVRQAKNQPNLRGVENSKKDKGLKFS